MSQYGLLPPSKVPAGLLGYDEKQARLDAFINGLGAMGPHMLAAGAPSTDPGNFGRQMAQAGQAFGQARGQSMQDSRNRAFEYFNISTSLASARRQQEQEQARAQYQNAMKMGGKDMAGQPVNMQGLLAAAYPDKMAEAQIPGLLGASKPIQVSPGATLYDPRTRSAMYTAPAQDAPTSLQRNLEAAGIAPSDPRYQQTILASLSKPTAQVNLNPGEPKANEELGKAIGMRLASQLEGGDKALSNLQTLSLMESAAAQLEQAGGIVGALAEPQAFASSLLQAVNVDPASLGLPADAGPAQILNSLGNKLTLGKIGGANGMPANNFSDADRKFIESTVPRLTDTPSAFKAKLFIDKRMAERSIQVAQEIDRLYSEGASASEMNRAVAAIKSRPLFSKDEIQNLRASVNGPGSSSPSYDLNKQKPPRVVRNPKTGKLEMQRTPQSYDNPISQGDHGPFRQLP